MVYPAWPSTASYGGRKWMSVHVDTARFNATRSRHPALPDVPNVKMHIPIDLGDTCRCISFENVYNLGVDKLTLEFSHEYNAVQAQMEGILFTHAYILYIYLSISLSIYIYIYTHVFIHTYILYNV